MPVRHVAIVLTTVLVVSTVGLPPARARTIRSNSGPVSNVTYVALGDSYSAGEGLDPYQAGTAVESGPGTDTCNRSASEAYPVLSPAVVLPQLMSRAFWACSGATSTDMDPPPGSHFKPQHNEPVQVSTVGPATRYISLTAGGDDLGFSEIGTACIEGIQIVTNDLGDATGKYYHLTTTPCLVQLHEEETRIPALVSNLTALYTDLLMRAPQADLVVLGYPRILPESYDKAPTFNGVRTCIFNVYSVLSDVTFYVGMTEQNATAADQFVRDLNGAIRVAVGKVPEGDAGRISFADSYARSIPRNCTGYTVDATVNGLALQAHHDNTKGFLEGFISSATLHPTLAGQRLFAQIVEEAFQKFSGSSGQTKPADVVWEYAPGVKSTVAFSNFLYTGDVTGELKQMHWTSWTATRAQGSGLDYVNACTPNCAQGVWHAYPVEVVLDKPVKVYCGSFYTDAVFHFTGGTLAGSTSQFVTTWTDPAHLCEP